MSGPDIDPHKQTRRHIGPVLGIVFVVVIALLGFVWWFYDETDDPLMPGEKSGATEEVSEGQNPPVEGEATPE